MIVAGRRPGSKKAANYERPILPRSSDTMGGHGPIHSKAIFHRRHAMLALNSPEWKNFVTYCGRGEDLPDSFQAWREAIGTPNEEGEWCNLRDMFLCQHTIKESAIAIVPHICRLLPTTSTTRRLDYVIDLGQVHMAWRRNPITSLSQELVVNYEASVVSIRSWACECLTSPIEPMEFRFVLSGVSALCDHAGLGRYLFSLDSSPSEFPELEGYV